MRIKHAPAADLLGRASALGYRHERGWMASMRREMRIDVAASAPPCRAAPPALAARVNGAPSHMASEPRRRRDPFAISTRDPRRSRGAATRLRALRAAACLALVADVAGAATCTDGRELTTMLGFAVSGESMVARDAAHVHWRRFEKALRDRGATVDVEIGQCGTRRGLRAARDAAAGDVVLALPRRLILDGAKADAWSVGRLWNGTKTSPLAKLALLVLHEARAREKAELAPYTMLLGEVGSIQPGDAPPFWRWRDDERAVMRCPAMEADARARRAWACGADTFRWVSAKLPGPEPSPQELEWAVATVSKPRGEEWVARRTPRPRRRRGTATRRRSRGVSVDPPAEYLRGTPRRGRDPPSTTRDPRRRGVESSSRSGLEPRRQPSRRRLGLGAALRHDEPRRGADRADPLRPRRRRVARRDPRPRGRRRAHDGVRDVVARAPRAVRRG